MVGLFVSPRGLADRTALVRDIRVGRDFVQELKHVQPQRLIALVAPRNVWAQRLQRSDERRKGLRRIDQKQGRREAQQVQDDVLRLLVRVQELHHGAHVLQDFDQGKAYARSERPLEDGGQEEFEGEIARRVGGMRLDARLIKIDEVCARLVAALAERFDEEVVHILL